MAEYLDTMQAAAFLRFRSASGVRNLVARGELVPVGRGARQCLLFTQEELERFIRARGLRYRVPRVSPAPSIPDEALSRPIRAPSIADESLSRNRRPSSFREIVARVQGRQGPRSPRHL